MQSAESVEIQVPVRGPAPLCAALVVAACVAVPAAARGGRESIAVLPPSIRLSGPEARQRLVVERVRDGRFAGDLRDGIVFRSSDPDVFVVRDGFAVPVGDGRATLEVEAGGRRATATVSVHGTAAAFRWSFRNHVLSVMAKAGCNSGACHGAIAGKNGFRLSLRGYDPEGDFFSVTRHAGGRRILPEDPGHSLVLTKPSGALPHKGGVRFAVGSRDYRVIADWIAAGTPPPDAEDPRITRLEVLPEASVLEPGMSRRLIVLAHFDDGHVEDVTTWAKYESTNSSVAVVGNRPDGVDGEVRVVGHGEGSITAWYLSLIAVATVTVPRANDVADEAFTAAPRRNFIDDLVLEKLQALRLPPSPIGSDEEFIRRAFIDTIGVLPTADEVRGFLADTDPGKRDVLIESLLTRPEFVDYWTYRLSDILLVSSGKLRPAAMWSYYRWIRRHVEANTPWDRFARELVTARGSTLENGAANFFVLHEDPAEMAENVTVAFLGMSINCAKCHNHPLEKWTNEQYYAMANLFARVRLKNAPGDGHRVVFTASRGDVVHPLSGRPLAPAPLEGDALPIDSPADRRAHLAEWLTSPGNKYFGRAIANRIWANFMGVGLVESVDDMRLTNPPSSEDLLAALAEHLVSERYDLRALMRAILRSAAYRRTSRPLPGNREDRRFYSRYYPRRLMAEVLLDALSQVTGSPTEFKGYPLGWRATQLPDTNVESYFLKSFGRPERETSCTCERTAEPNVTQVLHLSNGDTLNRKLEAKGNAIERLLEAGASDEHIVDELYLSALSRFPTESEKRRLLAVLAESSAGDRRKVVEDLFWSVLSSREFLFNH